VIKTFKTLIFLITIFINSALASAQITLTQEEKDFIKNHPTITLGSDKGWAPYVMQNDDETISGYDASVLKLINKISGANFKLKLGKFSDMTEKAKNRQIDGLSTAVITEGFKKYHIFSNPYISLEKIIFTSKDNPIKFNSLDDLNGKKFGVNKNNTMSITFAKSIPNVEIVYFKNTKELIESVTTGKADAMLGNAAMFYILSKMNNPFLKPSIFINDNPLNLVFVIRDDFPEAISIINKSLDAIGKETLNNLKNKWFKISSQKKFDYTLFWKIFGVIAILAMLLLWRYKTISKYNKKLEKYLTMIDENVLISSSDTQGNITQVSEALCKLTGYTKDELIGKNHNIFRHRDMPDSAFKDMWNTLKSGKSWNGEVKNLNKNGSFYWADVVINFDYNEDGNLKGYSAILQNITDKKKLEKLSITDALTQIPNRLYLDNNYKNELEKVKRYNHIFSIILMDIDYFKNVNDTFGHQVGDEVLIKIAQLLQENTRNIDYIGRWGGEEFLIICPQTDVNQATLYAEKIRITINDFEFPTVGSVTCSFGVSQCSPNNDNFKKVDEALYTAKQSGRDKVATA